MAALSRLFSRRHAGLWQGAAILIPLLLLAAIGWRGVQASRQDALDDARNEAARRLELAEPTLRDCWREDREAARALRLYPDPPLPPPAPDEIQLRCERALDSAADPELAQLEQQYPDALTASGLPFVALAEWTRLRVERNPAALPERAKALKEAAIYLHPSVLTPSLMEAAARLLEARGIDPGPVLPAWVLVWKNTEAARAAYRQHQREVDTAAAPRWIAGLGAGAKPWWIQPGTPPRFIAQAELAARLYLKLPRALTPPEYMSFLFSVDGVALQPVTGETLAAREVDGLRVALVLAEPDRLFTQQRRQTLWLAGLLALALAAAAAGFWTMRRALARERQLGELKSNFVSSVSHELRAPVASMRLMAENLESGAVPTEARRGEYHRLIAEECRRLSALIDNVLDFARIEQHRKTYDFIETDALALVRDALSFMAPRAAQRRQEVHAELAAIDPPPVCDGLAVRQALINLLDNAIKFSPEGTTIRVDLRPAGAAAWEIAVRDEGPGIAATEHRAIFERFHRLGSELRRETEGAGIGLSIVQHIAQAHGGRVTVDSQPGAGSSFTLHLPMQPAAV